VLAHRKAATEGNSYQLPLNFFGELAEFWSVKAEAEFGDTACSDWLGCTNDWR
jgi:hypothetical protein